jgi:cytochrome c-type biogenesis protein
MSFGVGMGFPLLLFSLLSTTRSTAIIAYLTEHRRGINLVAGILLLVISLYYLVCVFTVFGDMLGLSPVCRNLGSVLRVDTFVGQI